MDRFIIGHNVDPSNWRHRLDRLGPRCLEMFVPPRYCERDGLLELWKEFEQMAQHPIARSLEFASCHFPWGEGVNGYSKYNLIDDQYFFSFTEVARAFHHFCADLELPSHRCALNFHNLYELPRALLEDLKERGKLQPLRDSLLAHARCQTDTARAMLDILELPITLVCENNPPIGDGDRMSVVDVFAEDLASRNSGPGLSSCMDLSHLFMTRFYYDLPRQSRPSFPYLAFECSGKSDCARVLEFEDYLKVLRPLYFHVSDTKAPGTSRECEGVAVGTGDTPWQHVLPAIARYASADGEKIFLVIELKGGHTVEGTQLCLDSEQRLRELIEDCFASGFLNALSERGTPS